MDPNENLAELRKLAEKNADREFVMDDDSFRMIELFQALDEWLSKGGFPPGEWSPRRWA